MDFLDFDVKQAARWEAKVTFTGTFLFCFVFLTEKSGFPQTRHCVAAARAAGQLLSLIPIYQEPKDIKSRYSSACRREPFCASKKPPTYPKSHNGLLLL